MADPFDYQFSPSTVHELRDLLGAKLDAALPSLRFVAGMYEAIKQKANRPEKARMELSRLEALLQRTESAIAKLSPDATAILQRTIDWDASSADNSYVTGIRTLAHARNACARARVAVKDAQVRPMNSPAILLAAGVAGSLSAARLPLSKGRDGLLARVLAVVWYAVDPECAPVEIFRYLQAAVDIGLRQHPELKAPKGRPRK